MAQTGYTPISLYYSTTASAVPANTNLANGELAINITDGKLYYKDNTGTVKVIAGAGGAGVAGGSTTQVQYNSSGSLAGSANMTFDGTTLTAAGFSGPHNGTVGATTPNTGAFTTIRSSTGASSAIFGGGSSSNEVVTITAQTGGLGIGLGIQNSSSNLSGISFPTNASATTAYTYITADGRSGASGFIKSYVNDTVISTLTSTGLGIGTTSPAYKLDINKGSAGIVARFGGGGTNGILYSDTTFCAIADGAGSNGINIYQASNYLTFNTNGSEKMRLDSAGNLGLGVTPSAWTSTRAIDIGNATTNYASFSADIATDANISMNWNAYATSATAWKYKNNNLASRYAQAAGTHAWYTAPSGTAGNAITFTQAMTLDASGNLIVGGTSALYGASGRGVITINGSSQALLGFTIAGADKGFVYHDGNNLLVSNTVSASLLLQTSNTERFRIGSAGQLGIGGANYGTSGQVLTSQGSGSPPIWAAGGGGGGSAATPTTLGTVYGKTDASTLAFLGYQAGNANTSGVQSVAIGTGALQSNVTNNYNTAVGYYALQTATADQNVAVGWYALQKSTTGGGNTAVGAYVMNSNLGGAQNTALGFAALNSNTTGSANVAIGYQALYNNTTGGTNIGIGYAAGYGLRTNTLTPGQNIAIGNEALYSSSHAAYNIAIGYQALRGAGDNGGSSIAIGQQAGRICATPGSSIFIGYAAAYSNTYWIGGICIGQAAGYSYNDPGTPYPGNFFVGDGAGRSVTTGTGNVMLGAGESGYSGGPGRNTTSGSQNTVLGTAAFTTNTTSSNSTAIGYATISNSTGANNTALGSYAGTYNGGSGGATTSGAGNTFLGCQTIAANATDSYNVIIGYAIVGKGNATGYISANGGSIYQGNNSSSWATTSDRRLKKNIVDNTVGLEKLTQIQVRNFEYRLPEEVDAELKPHDAINKSGVQIGVIAQELQAVLPDCVKQESTGVLSVDPDNLTWYMVNAIKELNAKIEAQAAEIAILKGQA